MPTVNSTQMRAQSFQALYNLSQGLMNKDITIKEFERELGVNYTHQQKISNLMYFSQCNFITCNSDNKSFRLTAKGENAWLDFINAANPENKDFRGA